jgi:uncharacterized membrane protein
MNFQAKEYLLPCLNKKLFGVDCLGCGLQRSVLHVLKGEFGEAFKMYPAIFTLILLALFILVNWKYSFKNGRKIILTLATINILIIVVSYIIKMNQLF